MFHATICAPDVSRRWYRDQSAAILIQPKPNPVITMTNAPTTAWPDPPGSDVTRSRSIWSNVSRM